MASRFSRSCHRDFDSASASSDSQFTENDEELTYFEACLECDDDALYDMIQNGTTYEQVNEQDKSGRTGLSHACASGFMPILEILAEVDDVDPNLPDNDGNTPLIFAAQAGHSDVVNFLLHNFARVRKDQANHLGFTALMKSAVQGRTRCAKILLFAGANPNKRDYGRKLCAMEWAKFCGRQSCAEAIQKYLSSKKYFLKKTFMLSRWNSEPDLPSRKQKVEQQKDKNQGNWIQRHLSFKKKKRTRLASTDSSDSPSPDSPLASDKRTSSSPILITTCSDECEQTENAIMAAYRRPSCIDNVVPLNILPPSRQKGGVGGVGGGVKKFCANKSDMGALQEEEMPPPKIVETDFDQEKKDKESRGISHAYT